ncbi:MAG: acyl-CoA dehydrogenase [Bacteroidota bacterium]
MSTTPPRAGHYSPGVMSLIPLFYVGWADSVLSPSEVQLIQKKVKALPFLTAADKKLLATWSNPAQPPEEQLFRHWVSLIRRTAKELPSDSRQSLADLGMEMARQSASPQNRLHWQAPATYEALQELEQALQISSLEGYRNIFSPAQRQKEYEENINRPSFDVEAMSRLLDDDYHDIRQRLRTLMSDPAFHYQELPVKEDYREHVLHWCHLLAKQGLGALSYPSAYGGQDDMGSYAAVFEMLGYHDLSLTVKFGVQFGLFGGSVQWLGTQHHHDQYLDAIGKLELPGCFAMTETGHGSNVRGLRTTATYDPQSDEFIVHTPTREDGKEYIGNALHGRMASVFAQLIVGEQSHGVHAFLVPLRDEQHQLLPGIEVKDNGYKMGLNGVDNGRIWFNQVRIPRQNLLNRYGDVDEHGVYSSPIENPSRRFFTMLGTLVGGRVCVPRAGLSAAKSGLTIAIRYALRRRQFGPNDKEPETLLLDYPSHQKRLMPLLAKTYALDFALSYLSQRYVQRSEADIREIESLAAGLKAYATWFTTECLQECREACGGKGYLAENRFAALKADTEIFTTFEGDNTVLMQLVAKGMLTAFRQEFHNEGFRAVLRYLTNQLSTSVSEMNPFAIRNTEADHLLDSEFHLNAFRYRERRLLVTVSQRMRSQISKHISAYDAYIRSQNHILELGKAFVERLVLEKFVEKVAACEEEGLQKVLKKLCNLYALSTIETHKGWYLENEYISGSKSKAIRRMIERLCKDVRVEAGFLVDAFAIPDTCLAAPIAL